MLTPYQSPDQCPITATIDVFGGKWKPVILWVLMESPRRFGELSKAIPGVALKVLSRQLKELQEAGLVHREAFPEVPPRVEYSLTEKGESLRPLFKEMCRWSLTHILQREMAV